jgi:hypothetical protein
MYLKKQLASILKSLQAQMGKKKIIIEIKYFAKHTLNTLYDEHPFIGRSALITNPEEMEISTCKQHTDIRKYLKWKYPPASNILIFENI